MKIDKLKIAAFKAIGNELISQAFSEEGLTVDDDVFQFHVKLADNSGRTKDQLNAIVDFYADIFSVLNAHHGKIDELFSPMKKEEEE